MRRKPSRSGSIEHGEGCKVGSTEKKDAERKIGSGSSSRRRKPDYGTGSEDNTSYAVTAKKRTDKLQKKTGKTGVVWRTRRK